MRGWMQEPKSPGTGCASRACFGMQLPTPTRGRDGQGHSFCSPRLQRPARLRLARTGLAVADADVPFVPCPAVPALPALSEACARHSQDFSMAPNSCFPFLTPPKSADLLTAAEGLNSCQAAGNPRFNAGGTPKPAESLCCFCNQAGISSKWQEEGVGIAGFGPQSLEEPRPGGSGSCFRTFTHSASALGDKQPHVMLSHSSGRNSW